MIERLSSQDLITLWPDLAGWPQDMGALALMDGGPLAGPNGELLIDRVRAIVAARLHLTPRLRQVISTPPRGLGRPLWVDAADFDIAQHVRVHAVAAPGDEAQLLAAVERLRRRPLDAARPMWQLWLLPGVSAGRIGLYLRVHHALADGPAAVALLVALLDPGPGVTVTAAQSWTPAGRPRACDLLADQVRRGRAVLDVVIARAAHPGVLLSRARAAGSVLRGAVAGGRAPRSSLNQVIGPDRRLAVVARGDLDGIREVAHRYDATVNDVLLTAVAGGLRELLRGRGEQVDGLALQAIVPIALPHRREEGGQGNVLGQMIVALPVGMVDPVRRLRMISAQTHERKPGAGPRRPPVLRSRILQRAALWLLARQRVYNIYVANVPGPRAPLSLAGAPLLEVFPVVPLMGNLTIGVGALSYAGRFTVLAVGDHDTCRDLDVFAAAAGTDLGSLTSAAPSTPRPLRA